ncbi:MAG: hypothetical protein M1132_12015 [Chloroflexi bacterium]|nr:hypothetical protein [Chloroflexota bacterium]
MQRSAVARKGILFIVFLCVLLVAGCAAPPTANPPRERPTSVAPPAAGPVPTAKALPPQLFISLANGSPAPLHGSPPFSAQLTADLGGDPSLLKMCQKARWQFGDGAEETQACAAGSDGIYRFAVQHTYARPGNYYPTLSIELADGRTIQSENTETILVANSQPSSPVESVVFWGSWGTALLAAALAFVWLRRQSRAARTVGYVTLAFALVSFVPPFSYVPNPLGIYSAWLGSYSYDPRLPFVNRFVIAGDPTATLRPLLDALIGQTGLDPLDTTQPLAHYEFIQVRDPGLYGVTQVTTQFTYADGSQRTYNIPLYQSDNVSGLYQSDWRYDGLGRLRTEHRELPGTAFANASSSVQLGTPQLLKLPFPAQMLDADNPANWGPEGYAQQRLVWSPQGDAFLATQTVAYDNQRLWLVKLDGSSPVALADDVGKYAWSPDGQFVVFALSKLGGRVSIVSRDGSNERILAQGIDGAALPGITREGAWYAKQGELWIAPLGGGAPRRVGALPGLAPRASGPPLDIVVRPSPDGARVAYTCGEVLCLQDREGGNGLTLPISAGEMSWSRDGSRLAVVHGDYSRPAALTILKRDGTIERQLELAPNGQVDAPPQWTPDGGRLFVQTYPFNGRRILTVNVTTGDVLDLSQPRWDAWFALSPDGRRLLLTNGRGGFWTSEIAAK